jgi:hypothetical protein
MNNWQLRIAKLAINQLGSFSDLIIIGFPISINERIIFKKEIDVVWRQRDPLPMRPYSIKS